MIDIDNEAQEGIDAEEAAAAEFADNATDPADDAASEEGGEMEYLKELERIDRLIKATEEEYSDLKKEYNDKLKGLKSSRDATLDELEGFRNGERGLFDDKND